MTITLNSKPYNQDAAVDANTMQYFGPNHTISSSDLLLLKRGISGPTPAGVRYAKPRLQFERHITVDGKLVLVTIKVEASIPVGAAKADVDSIRDDAGDLLISTVADDLFWKQDITA